MYVLLVYLEFSINQFNSNTRYSSADGYELDTYSTLHWSATIIEAHIIEIFQKKTSFRKTRRGYDCFIKRMTNKNSTILYIHPAMMDDY